LEAIVTPSTPDAFNAPKKKTWLQENGYKLAVMLATLAAVCFYLNVLDVVLVCLGLGGIIFIHELGHFFAAKACNVYVRTFSIGFGPAWPFCEFKYGETHYKLGMIPLGGYVAMAGENTGETDSREATMLEADDTDPRSFKNKPVWQRMIIISAGVVMNVILAAICFLVAYSAGVNEPPAIVQAVEPGSAGWQAGLHPGSQITRINDIDQPMFQDITPEVASTNRGEKVSLGIRYQGTTQDYQIEPIKAEGAPFPQLGLPIPSSVKLFNLKRDTTPPYNPDSAADAWNTDHPDALIQRGDTVVAMSDIRKGGALTPLQENRDGLPGPTFDYRRRLTELAGQPVQLTLQRDASDSQVTVTLAPSFRRETGLRMKIGKVVAVRQDSAAMVAGVKAQITDGEKEFEPGDRLVEVAVPGKDGKRTVYALDVQTAGSDGTTVVKLLDPLRLPYDLAQWADATPPEQRKVTLTVVRDVDHAENRVTLEPLAWDDTYREDHPLPSGVNSPIPLGPLGLAYRVLAEVNAVEPGSPAAAAGVLPGDVITEAKYRARIFKLDSASKTYKPESKTLEWEPIKPHQWAFADYKLQSQTPHGFSLKLNRAGATVEVALDSAVDRTWPMPMEGIYFKRQEVEQKAKDLGEAMKLGVRVTLRRIKSTYQQLYGLISGRISVKMMNGPITLARTGYLVAGQDWRILVMFCGLISINLAVVNFLPIPPLDGGHMVFLIYEAIFRKPAGTSVQYALSLIGMIAVLALMLFTVGLDIWRLFFG